MHNYYCCYVSVCGTLCDTICVLGPQPVIIIIIRDMNEWIPFVGQPSSHVSFSRVSLFFLFFFLLWMMNVSMCVHVTILGRRTVFTCLFCRRVNVYVWVSAERTAKFETKINDYFVFNRHVLGYVLQRVDTHLLNRLNEFSVSIFLLLFFVTFFFLLLTSSRTTTS